MEGKVVFCGACGAAVSSNSKFCEYCGAKIFLESGKGQLTELESKNELPLNGNELMMVEDIFVITGRGTVVTGMSINKIKVGMKVVNNRTSKVHIIRGIEEFRKMTKSVEPHKNCGLLVDGDRNDFQRGDMLLAY